MQLWLNKGYVDRFTDDYYSFVLSNPDDSYEITCFGDSLYIRGRLEISKQNPFGSSFFQYPEQEVFDKFMEEALTSSKHGAMRLITTHQIYKGCNIHYSPGMKSSISFYKENFQYKFVSDLFKMCRKGNMGKTMYLNWLESTNTISGLKT